MRTLLLLLLLLLASCGSRAHNPDISPPDTPLIDAHTFTLALRVDFDSHCAEPSCRECVPSDPKRDCTGDVYWALAGKKGLQYLFESKISNARRGTELTIPGLPIASDLGVVAWMDDNSTALKDKGDFPFSSIWAGSGSLFVFTPSPGQVIAFTILFNSRIM